MSGGVLAGDPAVLRTAGTVFGQAGEQLSTVYAGAPLGEAAATVPQPTTSAVCRTAESAVAETLAVVAVGFLR